MRVRPLVEADGFAGEIGEALHSRVFPRHCGGRDEDDRRAERRPAGQLLLDDLRAVEEGEVVRAVPRPVERLVGIVRAELDAAVGAEQRRADRPAEVEIEAGRLAPVGRLADEPGARDAAATDDVIRLDALDDLAGVRGLGERKGESESKPPPPRHSPSKAGVFRRPMGWSARLRRGGKRWPGHLSSLRERLPE